jgi:cytochrome P450
VSESSADLLLRSRDTTQSTLTSAVYVLARNPDILARLRSEIIAAVGEDGIPTYQQARDIKYLRAFLNEVLRLYSPGKPARVSREAAQRRS